VERRRFLAALAGAVGVAGCSTRSDGGGDTPGTTRTEQSRVGTDDATAEASTGGLAARGIPATICSEPIQADPGIYAVDDPAFASDWAGREIAPEYRRDGRLPDDETVIGLTADGRARAYPLSVLTIHEIVNDEFGGPLLVTYCPLCRSGLVAERVVDGAATDFGVTGLLWRPERIRAENSVADGRAFGAAGSAGADAEVGVNGNLVMYDRATRSYWSQILGRAVCGPATGTRLSIRPSTVTTWGEWRADHPDTDVLLPPPYSETARPADDVAGTTPADR